MVKPTPIRDGFIPAGVPGRGGFCAAFDASGNPIERPFGFWTWGNSTNARVQSVYREFAGTSAIAQRHHERNRAVIEKRAPTLGDGNQRRALARREQAELKQRAERLAGVWADNLNDRDRLKHEIAGEDHAHGKELRDFLRGQSTEQRAQFIRRPEYRQAAMFNGLPAELSGLSPAQRDAMVEEAVAQRYPERLRELDQESEALDVARMALANTRFAVEEELKSVGLPVEEPPAPAPSKPWAVA